MRCLRHRTGAACLRVPHRLREQYLPHRRTGLLPPPRHQGGRHRRGQTRRRSDPSHIRCATASPPTCWTAAAIPGRCRRSWVMRMRAAPRSTPRPPCRNIGAPTWNITRWRWQDRRRSAQQPGPPAELEPAPPAHRARTMTAIDRRCQHRPARYSVHTEVNPRLPGVLEEVFRSVAGTFHIVDAVRCSRTRRRNSRRPLLRTPPDSPIRVNLCRGQNSTLRGEVAVECAIDGRS